MCNKHDAVARRKEKQRRKKTDLEKWFLCRLICEGLILTSKPDRGRAYEKL